MSFKKALYSPNLLKADSKKTSSRQPAMLERPMYSETNGFQLITGRLKRTEI
jgi:hypothetical protein